MKSKHLLMLFALLWLPSMAQAQTSVPCATATTAQKSGCTNPTAVEFAASPSDGQTQADGTPLVSGYAVKIVRADGSTVGTPTPAGHPPIVGGLISVVVPEFVTLPDGSGYTSVIQTIGPGGTVDSIASLPFVRVRPAAPPQPAGRAVNK